VPSGATSSLPVFEVLGPGASLRQVWFRLARRGFDQWGPSEPCNGSRVHAVRYVRCLTRDEFALAPGRSHDRLLRRIMPEPRMGMYSKVIKCPSADARGSCRSVARRLERGGKGLLRKRGGGKSRSSVDESAVRKIPLQCVRQARSSFRRTCIICIIEWTCVLTQDCQPAYVLLSFHCAMILLFSVRERELSALSPDMPRERDMSNGHRCAGKFSLKADILSWLLGEAAGR